MLNRLREKLTTEYLGRNIEYHETIESTQLRAKELAKEKIPNGTIVMAGMQTNGIGTHGRKWLTDKDKNILMTMILFPECKIEKLEGLTIMIANTLKEVIYDLYKIEAHVKIPNDLMLNSKKIAGILTETKVENEIVKTLFVGIGMNVNQEKFPEEIENIATSLKNEIGEEFDKEQLVSEFLSRFEREFLSGGTRRSLSLLNSFYNLRCNYCCY